VDPFGYNFSLEFPWNKLKQRQDVRIEKYLKVKSEPQLNAFILGSSRVMAIDPSLLDQLAPVTAYNLGIGAATIPEMAAFTNWILSDRNVKVMVYGLDLFNFADNFDSQGRLPKELEREGARSYEASPAQYLTQKMTISSIKTIRANLDPTYRASLGSQPDESENGMRIYQDYLDCKPDPSCLNKYIEERQSTVPEWHTKVLSGARLRYLKEITEETKRRQVNTKYFMTPLPIAQIRLDDFSHYLMQLHFLKEIVAMTGELYDCNLFSEINNDPFRFVDHYHFNYDVGDLILKDLFSKDPQYCKKLTADNIDAHVEMIEAKIEEDRKSLK